MEFWIVDVASIYFVQLMLGVDIADMHLAYAMWDTGFLLVSGVVPRCLSFSGCTCLFSECLLLLHLEASLQRTFISKRKLLRLL